MSLLCKYNSFMTQFLYVSFAINYSVSIALKLYAYGLGSLFIRSYTLMNGKWKQYTELRHNGNNRNISIAIIRTQERNSLTKIENKRRRKKKRKIIINESSKEERNNSEIVNMAADSDRMKMSRLLNLAKKFNCFYLSGEFIQNKFDGNFIESVNQTLIALSSEVFYLVNHLKSSVRVHCPIGHYFWNGSCIIFRTNCCTRSINKCVSSEQCTRLDGVSLFFYRSVYVVRCVFSWHIFRALLLPFFQKTKH